MADDRVWHRGRIFTGRRWVTRLVADGGRIVAADDGGASGPEVPTGAERIDLRGALVVPAFIDAHLHVTESARRPAGAELRGSRGFEEIAERVQAVARATRGPVWGGGWDQDRLAERRMPTRVELDRWLPDRPLLLTRVCDHLAVLNSAGLAAVGVDRSTPDPPGGAIDRDASGEPTGVLRERALGHLRKFPFPTLTERPDLGIRFLGRCAALGIAAVAGLRASPEEVAWVESGPGGSSYVRPRYRAYGGASDPQEVEAWGRARRQGLGSIAGIKLFADGSFGARSAWLEEPYSDDPGTSGGPVQPPATWEAMVRTADSEGLRVAAHALGDRGLRQVLETLETVGPSARPRIEHAGLVPEALLARLSQVSADVVVQPGFRRSDVWLADRLGPERIRSAYPLATLRRRGIRLAGSSDSPAETLDPVDGLLAAVTVDGVGEPLVASEALALYTQGGAEVLELPDLGHLEPGAAASLVAFPSADPPSLAGVSAGAVRTVWLDGRPVPTVHA